ncbi:hypothetical protein [Rhodopirellula sallentina]|uniref:Secreted protein n=1 Tax=Rhodopirellula sallentina SM41 TaxID=1263870 RepID=M5TU74_9BACT|nr:hypothetical protein [Rhodopirellula sallentina]EMI52700.1 secreted protein [Rhodopirellula sallentina SM41]
MADRRKTLLTAVGVLLLFALPVGLFAFLDFAWFGPARIYADAQSRCEDVFAQNDWSGYPLWFHYDYRVRFVCPELDDDNVSLLYPIIHSVDGLRYIELYATDLSDDGVAAMEHEFPHCHFTVYDQWF